MRPIHRWSLVVLAVALAVLVPMSVRALPVHDQAVTAPDLLARVQGSGGAGYSGEVEVHGRLGLPVSDHFTDVADLLGGDTRMRVWWRNTQDWRVDKLLPTGEIDLFRHGRATIRWDFEREEAQTSLDPPIRLPRDADLLPPALARRALADARPDEVSRLPARRIAGRDAVGLRLQPSDPRTSIDHVDLWADAASGLVLALDAYGPDPQPVLSTAFTQVDLSTPAPRQTSFHAARGLRITADDVLDIADAANQYAPVLPPVEVAGLPRSGSSTRAVGIYGTGLAQLMAVPLQSRDAGYLAEHLHESGAAETGDLLLLRVGPLGIALTFSHEPFHFAWLVTGTVTDQTLEQAVQDLAAGTRFRG
jgi:hypothetical protein